MSYFFGMTPATYVMVGAFDEERTALSRPEWAYQCRVLHLIQSANQFSGLWPASRISSGDPTAPATLLGQDSGQTGAWGPMEIGTIGNGGPTTFLSGRTLDGNSNPLYGVTVRGYRTSDNLFVGQTTSDANANYSLGAVYPGVTHYLEAYFPAPNLLQYSQTFTNAYWNTGGGTCTVGSTVTAPDGTTTAYILTEASTTGNHQLQLTTPYAPPNGTAGTFIFSIYAKLGTSADRRIYVGFADGSGNGCVIILNLATGVAGDAIITYGSGYSAASGGINTDSIATGVGGNGWYRCWATAFTTTNAVQSPNFGLDNLAAGGNTNSYAGNGTSSIQVWGAQFNFGGILKPYVATTALVPDIVGATINTLMPA
jgi:hypothetical protein